MTDLLSVCDQRPAVHTPADRQVVAAQLVAGAQLVRTRRALDTHAAAGTTRQRAPAARSQQTTAPERPQVDSSAAGTAVPRQRARSVPGRMAVATTSRTQCT
jgi:hypothetical protein